MRFDSPLSYLLLCWLVVNLSAFILMMIDKMKAADAGSRRISEGQLFFMAAAFGAVGVYAGMFACRHKTRKWYFILGVPLLIAQNFAFIYLLSQLFFIPDGNFQFIFLR
ncbi:MAG: DUF1294 domain-containing protein [Patescibacteria group bacterium]|nr:DUF1294 domain-containing protein [Patescibacteria group bacterium]